MNLDGRKEPRTRAVIACLLVVAMIATPGCSSWKALRSSSETQVTALPHHVHVLLADGRRIEVFSARVEGDSLVGMCHALGAHGDGSGRDSCAIAVRDILRIDSKQFSAGRTVLLIGGIVVFLGAAA